MAVKARSRAAGRLEMAAAVSIDVPVLRELKLWRVESNGILLWSVKPFFDFIFGEGKRSHSPIGRLQVEPDVAVASIPAPVHPEGMAAKAICPDRSKAAAVD